MAESLGAHYRFVKGGSRRLLRFPRGDDDDDDDVEDQQLTSTPVDQSLTDIEQHLLSRVPQELCFRRWTKKSWHAVLAATHGFICLASDISRKRSMGSWDGIYRFFEIDVFEVWINRMKYICPGELLKNVLIIERWWRKSVISFFFLSFLSLMIR